VWVKTLQWHEALTAASKNYPTRDYVTHPTNAMVHSSHFEEASGRGCKAARQFFDCHKKAHKSQKQFNHHSGFLFCAFCAFLQLILLRGYCLRM
jgi:hypothetical protein